MPPWPAWGSGRPCSGFARLTGEEAQHIHEAVQIAAAEGLTLLWPDLDRWPTPRIATWRIMPARRSSGFAKIWTFAAVSPRRAAGFMPAVFKRRKSAGIKPAARRPQASRRLYAGGLQRLNTAGIKPAARFDVLHFNCVL